MTAVIPNDERPLSEVVAEVEHSHGQIDIVHNGEVVAVIVSPEYMESLQETIEIAADPELMAAIARGEAELANGEGIDGDVVAAQFLRR
jgi:prevent-host-death family protein